ncbi:DUF6708 domain-containing protein [Cupriavidus sp. PET2-C1]
MKFPTKDERTPFYFRQTGKPLGAWELQHRVYIDKPASEDVLESGNVYRIDSTCLEITDESQTRMQNVGMLCMICSVATILFLGMAGMFATAPYDLSAEVMARKGNWFGVIFGTIFCIFVAGFFGLLAFDPMRRNLFTLKRRPIRLNRKTRRIYAMRTKDRDGMWEVPWSNTEFFCIGHRRMGGLTRAYDMYDIRHYQLDEDGNVMRAFVLGQFVFTLEQACAQWEYYRRYMQEGPAGLPEPHRFWAPNESFWEGVKICREDNVAGVLSTFSDLVFSPFILLDAICRWLILATCRDPVWPPDIEAACEPEPNDPYARPYADDYIGFASGAYAQPSEADRDRMFAQLEARRRDGVLTRDEAEALLRKRAG